MTKIKSVILIKLEICSLEKNSPDKGNLQVTC